MPPTTNLGFSLPSPSNLPTIPITPLSLGQPPAQTLPELFSAAKPLHNAQQIKSRVANYYFLFLALLTAILAGLLWWLCRQRKSEREQIRLRGQNALTQDVERWTMHRGNEAHVVEGLDETGAAPPPYQAKGNTVTTHETMHGDPELVTNVAMPPRALLGEDTERSRLPEYSVALQVTEGST